MSNEEQINIEVDGQKVACAPGATLLNVIQGHHIAINTACGGRGNCHLCRLTVIEGGENLPPPNSIERKALGNLLIAAGMRLSCQIQACEGLCVKLPEYESPEARRARIKQARLAKKSR